MTRRLVGVLPLPAGPAARAAGIDADLRAAMVEDCYETVAGLALVEPVLLSDPDDPDRARLAALTWPGTAVLTLPAAAPRTAAALDVLAGAGAEQAVVVAGDAPDLPGLLVGKLHRALGGADVAVLPAAGGGLVAVAVRVPVAAWVPRATLDIDDPAALAALRAAAPRRTAVSVGPGWHRVRRRDDLAHLDPGLEGWEVTRAFVPR